MKDLSGKVAFITGGASGIGLAMAKAFLREGMKVMIADIDEAAIGAALDELAADGQSAGVRCDVTDRASFAAAADRTLSAFGRVHVVCNNAGVAVVGPVGTIPQKNWDWILDVNLKGVIHGTETFLPLMERHGEGGHFVNTASMSALVVRPGREPYAATKYAVMALSEGWAIQLAEKNIGVSILCPGYVQTRIAESGRARPNRYGGPQERDGGLGSSASAVAIGIPAEPIGERVVEAIKSNELYVITHPEMKDVVAARFESILAAFDRAAKSPVLLKLGQRAMPQQDVDLARRFRQR